jgi:hypothetical protein
MSYPFVGGEWRTEFGRQRQEHSMTDAVEEKEVLDLLQPMLPHYRAVPEFGPLLKDLQQQNGLTGNV